MYSLRFNAYANSPEPPRWCMSPEHKKNIYISLQLMRESGYLIYTIIKVYIMSAALLSISLLPDCRLTPDVFQVCDVICQSEMEAYGPAEKTHIAT